ncbi:MAG: hypothetical protein HYY04_18795 [Chloroflexi bacterium]|nr:hypothetical protein [Chloroflexota bacterium]
METRSDTISERTRLARERLLAFWQRQMSDQILVEFSAPGARRSNELPEEVLDDQRIAEGCPPLFEDIPRLLRDLEAGIGPAPTPDDEIWDDSLGIKVAVPEFQFNCGVVGAMLGGRLHVASSATHTMTFNDPVVTDWVQLDGLALDESERNVWLQRVLGCVRYFVEHASKPFVIRPFLVYEGANFVVSMRGTTQAFFDLGDRPPQLRDLYELGYRTGARLLELKQSIVRPHNERILGHKLFADTAPIHAVPWLDTDAYSLCSPRVFAEIGLEFKQRIVDHFGGGMMHIHGLGQHIVPIAGRLKRLTYLSLYDDPNCVPYFDRRIEFRAVTHDTPLTIGCTLKDLVTGLADRTLPGGVKYTAYVPQGVTVRELNGVMERVRAYRVGRLAGNPAPAA